MTNKMTQEYILEDLRKSLDNIDNAMLTLLAERFRVTDKVGILKKEKNLPSVDKTREDAIFVKVEKLSEWVGLDVEIAKKIMRLIIDEVVKRHESLKE